MVENRYTQLSHILLQGGCNADVDNNVIIIKCYLFILNMLEIFNSFNYILLFQKGLTSLHIASSLGCRGIIEALLQYGSDIDRPTKVSFSIIIDN